MEEKMKIKCFCGAEHEINLPEDNQVIDKHFSLVEDPLPEGEIAVENEKGDEKCFKCGKRLVLSYDKGLNTGSFKHPLEDIVDRLALRYGTLRLSVCFILCFIFGAIYPTLFFTLVRKYEFIPKDYFVIDGFLSSFVLAFFCYHLFFLRKNLGNLEVFVNKEKRSRFTLAVYLIHSKKVYAFFVFMMICIGLTQVFLIKKESGSSHANIHLILNVWTILTPFVFQVVCGYFAVLYQLITFKGLFKPDFLKDEVGKPIISILIQGKQLIVFTTAMFVIRSVYLSISFLKTDVFDIIFSFTSIFYNVAIPLALIMATFVVFSIFESKLSVYVTVERKDKDEKYTLILQKVHDFKCAGSMRDSILS